MKSRADFIKALADFLVGDQGTRSIELEMRRPHAIAWAGLRQTTPLVGYPTVNEAEVILGKWLLEVKGLHLWLLEIRLHGSERTFATSIHHDFSRAVLFLREQYGPVTAQSDEVQEVRAVDGGQGPLLRTVIFDSEKFGAGFAKLDEFEVL